MTDLAPALARDDHSGPSASPPARRLTRRRWRDSRLLIGILLVLISVVLGARLFALAENSSTWVVAKTDLPAGHVIVAADLATASARLDSPTGERYYPGRRSSEIVGAMLARPVSAGELLSGDDFVRSRATPTRIVPLVVKNGRAPGLRPGDHVSVYVYRGDGTAPAGSRATGAPGEGSQPAAGGGGAEVLVLHDVEFLGEKVLSGGDRSLSLRVPVELAINAVAASQSERVDVVKLERGTGGDPGPAGPTLAPGYGR